MEQHPRILAEGTRLHSLRDGHYLVTVAKDYHLGDTFSVDHFKDWPHEAPKKGDPMSDDLMDVVIAVARGWSATTGVCVVRMDNGRRV